MNPGLGPAADRQRVIAPLDHVQTHRGRHAGEHRPQFVRRAEGVALALHDQHRCLDVGQMGRPRLIGPAWHTNRYTASTMDTGPLTDLGRQLLARMQRLGMILDVSHMADEACLEALDRYAGPVIASHANPRRLVPINRSLSDRVIAGLVERDGVIGIMPLTWALDPAWRKPKTKADIHLTAVVEAIDVVCQIAGDAQHVGLGTDFDGGQGADRQRTIRDAGVACLAHCLVERSILGFLCHPLRQQLNPALKHYRYVFVPAEHRQGIVRAVLAHEQST